MKKFLLTNFPISSQLSLLKLKLTREVVGRDIGSKLKGIKISGRIIDETL